VPLAPHVCTPLPEHWVAPGVHEPEHAPLTQAELEQAAAVPHCPEASQVSTPLPEHRAVPGAQTP
jgi:hypothetical protein